MDQSSELCSRLLDHFVHAWSAAERDKPAADKTLALFFVSGSARFDGPGEGAIPGSIQTWLARLHLARHDYAPLLCLDEAAAGTFALTLAAERGAATTEPPVPLAAVLSDKRWAKARYAILQQVAVLAEFFPPLAAHLSSGADKPLTLSSTELPAFLFDTLPAVRLLGVRALLPKALDRVLRPAGLQAVLRPYQRRGYAWLYRNARVGLGSVIADDMGLGKTLQVIAALQKLKEEGALADASALVVMPTSLLTNWHKELQRFAPELTVGIFHGSKRELGAKRPEVLLTSYGIARSEAAKLKAVPWRVVVADEAQNIKNPSAAQTKAIKTLPAQSFIAMSGTPVENRLSEYWSIMDFANRGYLGSVGHFVKEYAVPIQTHHDTQVVSRFKRVTAPFLMRRLK